jgi:hypothetical protein
MKRKGPLFPGKVTTFFNPFLSLIFKYNTPKTLRLVTFLDPT